MIVLTRAQKALLALCLVINLYLVARVMVFQWKRALTVPLPPRSMATPPQEIVVHVAGRVRRPGVYRLSAGARGVDALKAAGGALDDACLDDLNLAAPLQDGSQLRVRSIEEVRSDMWSPTSGAGSNPVPTRQVDLNTASAARLQQIPGIGPVTAQRIVEYRRKHGPFRTPDDLDAVPGIGAKTIRQIRPYVRF